MRLLELAFKRETAAPVSALIFASVASVALVLARVAWTGNIMYGFLIWNLFLAWLPLALALLAADAYERAETGRWRPIALGTAWLLFFPNAPYILTDITHLTNRYSLHFWVDLTLVLLCALTGLVLGFVSLYLMQGVVARAFGRLASWAFIALVTGLTGFGIYLGRFLRFNSWDVVLRPGRVYQQLDAWMDGSGVNQASPAFLVLFATFLFIAYLTLYALTHLSPGHQLSAPVPAKALDEI